MHIVRGSKKGKKYTCIMYKNKKRMQENAPNFQIHSSHTKEKDGGRFFFFFFLNIYFITCKKYLKIPLFHYNTASCDHEFTNFCRFDAVLQEIYLQFLDKTVITDFSLVFRLVYPKVLWNYTHKFFHRLPHQECMNEKIFWIEEHSLLKLSFSVLRHSNASALI